MMTTRHPTAAPDRLRRALCSSELNTSPRLSPDGRRVMFVRTVDEGQELWLRTRDGVERRAAVHHGELIADLRWTADGAFLMYRHTQRGRERWRLAGVRTADLTPVPVPVGETVIEYWLSPLAPGSAVCAHRGAGSGRAVLSRVELDGRSGDPEVIASGAGFHRWLVDAELRPRGGIRFAPDGSVEILVGQSPQTARPVLAIGIDDASDLSVQGFSRDGTRLHVLTSSGARTRRLLAVDCGTGAATTVFEHPDLDVESYPIAGEGVWFHPVSGRPDLCSVMDQRLHYHALSEEQRGPLARLEAVHDDTAVVLDRSADDRCWLTVHVRDDGPIGYHLFDPEHGKAEPLFVNRPELAGHDLPRLEDFCCTADDGTALSGYAMRPLGADGPCPTVVLVHGGPAGRDFWRFHAEAQYLATLGYLTLHINYRGSRGFGSGFRLLGNGEWGRRMQQDLYDAVRTGVIRGMVDPDRVAFLGASYGGYAALLAACTRPGAVRCAVAVSPPCDLVSLVERPPRYWLPLALQLRRQILGPAVGPEADTSALAPRSPLHVLDASCAPVLLAHGVHDPRVPVAEVDRFAERARELGVMTRYLRFDDEGHHVKSNTNREILFSEIANFLEAHLATR